MQGFAEEVCTKKVSIFKKWDMAHLEPETMVAFQIRRASLAVLTYAMKDGLIWQQLFQDFCGRNFTATLLNRARLLQFLLEYSQEKTKMLYAMIVPKGLKA